MWCSPASTLNSPLAESTSEEFAWNQVRYPVGGLSSVVRGGGAGAAGTFAITSAMAPANTTMRVRKGESPRGWGALNFWYDACNRGRAFPQSLRRRGHTVRRGPGHQPNAMHLSDDPDHHGRD